MHYSYVNLLLLSTYFYSTKKTLTLFFIRKSTKKKIRQEFILDTNIYITQYLYAHLLFLSHSAQLIFKSQKKISTLFFIHKNTKKIKRCILDTNIYNAIRGVFFMTYRSANFVTRSHSCDEFIVLGTGQPLTLFFPPFQHVLSERLRLSA